MESKKERYWFLNYKSKEIHRENVRKYIHNLLVFKRHSIVSSGSTGIEEDGSGMKRLRACKESAFKSESNCEGK